MNLIDLCSAVLGLTCVFLATRARKENFWVGYLYNIFLFFLFMEKHLYANMLLQPISFAINIYGHYRWTHPNRGEANTKNELKISLLSWRERGLYLGAWVVMALCLGFALSRLQSARQPWLDAFGMVTVLTAQLLSAKKKLECWACWTTFNVTNLILYIRGGLLFMPIVATAYLGLATFGFLGWRKMWKQKK